MVVSDFRRAALPVISAGPVLAEKVFIQEFGLHWTRGGMKAQGFACEPNKVFQYHRIVNRIRQGTAMNVHQLDCTGLAVARWCFTPEGGVVTGDVLLAQKIALETMEREALALANTQTSF